MEKRAATRYSMEVTMKEARHDGAESGSPAAGGGDLSHDRHTVYAALSGVELSPVRLGVQPANLDRLFLYIVYAMRVLPGDSAAAARRCGRQSAWAPHAVDSPGFCAGYDPTGGFFLAQSRKLAGAVYAWGLSIGAAESADDRAVWHLHAVLFPVRSAKDDYAFLCAVAVF